MPLILPPALPLVGKPGVMPSNSHKIEKAPTDKQACRWHFPIYDCSQSISYSNSASPKIFLNIFV